MCLGNLLKWIIFKVVTSFLFLMYKIFAPSRSHLVGKKVPPVSDPLLLMSARQLATKIRRKEVTSVEVVQAYINRIQEVNPLLNAIVIERFDLALQEAAKADKLVEEETGGEEVLEDQLPLLGVPLSVKESYAVQGMPLTGGLVHRKDILATADSPPVLSLKRSGAIVLGVTNTPELCMWGESHNHLYGITNNPYDLCRTPGGSSGGEGSILGGAGSVIGIGSDIAGSIRMPCFFNGIFGHKTTPGVVTSENQYPPTTGRHEEYVSNGPMCRYAEDLLPVLKIMSGPNAHMLKLDEKVDLKTLRYFTIPDDNGSLLVPPVTQELIDIQKKVVQCLEEDLGVKVEEVRFPELCHSVQMWNTYMNLPDRSGKQPEAFNLILGPPGYPVRPVWELVKWLVGRSTHTFASICLALQEMTISKPSPFILQQKEKLQKELEELLGDDGVFLYPTHPRVAPVTHHPLFRPLDFSYTGVINVLGLPVTQCPLGLNKDGIPIGVQVGCGKMQDRLSLEVALYLEKTFGGWKEPQAA